MKRLLLLIAAFFALASPSLAADNYTATQGTGKTFGCKDVAGVCFPEWIPVDSTGALFGVTGNPIFVVFPSAQAVTATLAAETTKVIGTVRIASGGVASGAYASGAFASGSIASGAVASGAYASGSIASGAMVDLGAQADAACATDNGTCSAIALIKRGNQNLTTANTSINSPIPAGTNTIGTVGQLTYPVGATPITASATGTTAATTATLAGTSGKTTYICWSSVRANATANANVQNTITGVVTGTLTRQFWVPANTVGLGIDEMIYSPCMPASGTNQGIAVVSGAPGSGGNVTVNSGGYQL